MRKARVLIGLLLFSSLVYGGQVWFGTNPGRVLIIYAQTLPLTRTLSWTDDPLSDPATSHSVTLDGTVVGTPSGMQQSFIVTTLGTHVLTVTETNAWGTSPAATLTITVRQPVAPGALRVQ
jgi:hypothetical protein